MYCCVKVEVTYFEDLEETHAEVKLRQSLWQAQKEWDADYLQWMEVNMFVVLGLPCITGATKILLPNGLC